MWNRKDLKRQGKAAFRRNYWKSVLAGVIVLALAAGMGVTGGRSSYQYQYQEVMTYPSDAEYGEQNTDPEGWTYKDSFDGEEEAPGENDFRPFEEEVPEEDWEDISPAELIATAAISILIGLLFLAIGILLRIWIGNPLEAGGKRFFLMNLRQEPAEAKELTYAFDHGWKNTGVILFYRDLYLILWTLFFIIPGLVKSYEYRMIPYLLAEDPSMTRQEAFALSRSMMKGQKGKAFLLDLSFIGWNILSVLTLGMVAIFYAVPYQLSTGAALYAKLRYGMPQMHPRAAEVPATAAEVPVAATEVSAAAAEVPVAATEVSAAAAEVPVAATEVSAAAAEIVETEYTSEE